MVETNQINTAMMWLKQYSEASVASTMIRKRSDICNLSYHLKKLEKEEKMEPIMGSKKGKSRVLRRIHKRH